MALDTFHQDVRHAARALLARPAVTAVAVVSLALGIGVNTAIYSLFEHLLLRRLPVPAPEQIVNVTAPGPRPGRSSTDDSGGLEAIFSYPLFRDLERLGPPAAVPIAGHSDFDANFALRGQTTEANGLFVSGGYFTTLGLTPSSGRLLAADDDRPGGAAVVVLSHRYWTLRYGADPAVVGQPAVVNGVPMTVVGIAPEGFVGTTVTAISDLFVPLASAAALRPAPANGLERRDDHWIYAFGRLAAGVTPARAASALNVPFGGIVRDEELTALRARLPENQLSAFTARQIVLEDGARGRNRNRQEIQVIVGVLLAVTGLVLLIACANVANLLLARATDRSAELAVRLALGGSRYRLVRLLLTEAALLGGAAGAVALLVARAALAGLVGLVPPENMGVMPTGLSWTVFAVALATGVGAGVLFGLFPAIHATAAFQPATRQAIDGATTRLSASRTATRFRTVLATAQIALATALLAEAGLLIANLTAIARADLGIAREGLITFGVAPAQNGYQPERSRTLFDRLDESLRATPGVTAVSGSTVRLLDSSEWASGVTVQGSTLPDDASQAYYAHIGVGYFDTLGSPILAGRDFTAADGEGAPLVAIVNETFVRRFGLGERAVGSRMRRGRSSTEPLDIEIVGVVRDAKYSEATSEIPAQFFQPYRQFPTGQLTFYVRTTADVQPVMAAVPALVGRADPTLPVSNLRTLDNQLWQNTVAERLLATLSAAFAALAAGLAAIGLYAVLAYTVARRRREFGIRAALGAAPGDVRAIVLAHVGRMTLAGVIVGAGLALGLGRLGKSLLFGVDALEPGILGIAAALVAGVALIAGIIPARRAATVPAADALRAQ
jgi:predicted permease